MELHSLAILRECCLFVVVWNWSNIWRNSKKQTVSSLLYFFCFLPSDLSVLSPLRQQWFINWADKFLLNVLCLRENSKLVKRATFSWWSIGPIEYPVLSGSNYLLVLNSLDGMPASLSAARCSTRMMRLSGRWLLCLLIILSWIVAHSKWWRPLWLSNWS